MNTVQLKPFRAVDFGILASWVTSAELLLQFAGTEFTYPLTYDQLERYGRERPDRQFYMGYVGLLPVFFGEMIPQEGDGPRLGRLLVGDTAKRGQGLGEVFVRLLINEAVKQYGAQSVYLYVWENNAPAIACYKRTGFRFAETEPYTMTHEGVSYKLLKMRIDTDAVMQAVR